jgi:hypothetical protein
MVYTHIKVVLSWKDRIKVFLFGWFKLEVTTETENYHGWARSETLFIAPGFECKAKQGIANKELAKENHDQSFAID